MPKPSDSLSNNLRPSQFGVPSNEVLWCTYLGYGDLVLSVFWSVCSYYYKRVTKGLILTLISNFSNFILLSCVLLLYSNYLILWSRKGNSNDKNKIE